MSTSHPESMADLAGKPRRREVSRLFRKDCPLYQNLDCPLERERLNRTCKVWSPSTHPRDCQVGTIGRSCCRLYRRDYPSHQASGRTTGPHHLLRLENCAARLRSSYHRSWWEESFQTPCRIRNLIAASKVPGHHRPEKSCHTGDLSHRQLNLRTGDSRQYGFL